MKITIGEMKSTFEIGGFVTTKPLEDYSYTYTPQT